MFRLETLQSYSVSAEDAALVAFRTGSPRPERSIRTSPWLRRIAIQVIAGVDWSRVRIVEFPLTEYTRMEIIAYVESQAAGERTLLTDHSEPVGPDFWLRDGGTDDAEAIVMHYTPEGELDHYEVVDDPARLAELYGVATRLTEQAVTLNVFLSELRNADVSQA